VVGERRGYGDSVALGLRSSYVRRILKTAPTNTVRLRCATAPWQ
jgi:hypothetical protein